MVNHEEARRLIIDAGSTIFIINHMAKRRGANNDGTMTYSQVMMLFESIEKQVQITAEQYGTINEKLTVHSSILERLERDMETVKTELVVIRKSLKTKADRESLDLLERRLATVEAKMR